MSALGRRRSADVRPISSSNAPVARGNPRSQFKARTPWSDPPPTIERRARYARDVARYGRGRGRGRPRAVRQARPVPAVGESGPCFKAIRARGPGARRDSSTPMARGTWPPSVAQRFARFEGWQPEEVQSSIELAGSMKLGRDREGRPDLGGRKSPRRSGPLKQRNLGDGGAGLDRTGRNRSRRLAEGGPRRQSNPSKSARQAANLLNGAWASPEPRTLLVEAMATAPARLQTAIATGLAQNRAGSEALLEAVLDRQGFGPAAPGEGGLGPARGQRRSPTSRPASNRS